jgi:hypothetical protein
MPHLAHHAEEVCERGGKVLEAEGQLGEQLVRPALVAEALEGGARREQHPLDDVEVLRPELRHQLAKQILPRRCRKERRTLCQVGSKSRFAYSHHSLSPFPKSLFPSSSKGEQVQQGLVTPPGKSCSEMMVRASEHKTRSYSDCCRATPIGARFSG